MLQGSARTWLNSFPSNNINCWEDFSSAFIHNFTSTYDRPNLPRQLARCVAVRYEPLMLQGSARTWLNSLPSNSINCWEDFSSAFIHNFTSTYDRPNLPRQLALVCKARTNPSEIT